MKPGPRGALSLPALGAILAAAAFLQGAFYLRQLAPIALAAAVAALIVRPRRDDRMLGFGLLGAGLLASTAANRFPDAAAKPALTLVFCIAVFVLARRAAAADRPAAVLDAVVAVAAGVAVLGLIGVAFHVESWAFLAGAWRLASTLTYQNAAAALFAVALPAALARVESSSHRVAVVLLTIALIATGSRAGALAALVGVAVFVGFGGAPQGVARLCLGALVAGGALAPSLDGAAYGPVLAIVGIAAGCALAASRPQSSISPRARAIAGTVLGMAAVALAIGSLATPLRERLSLNTNERIRTWQESFALVDEDMLFGSGPGTYRLRTSDADRPVVVLHAHNEYVQATVETGFFGLATVLAAIGVFGRALLQARPRARDPVWAASLASTVAFLLHSGLDFLWRVPVLPAFVFALFAVALPRARRRA